MLQRTTVANGMALCEYRHAWDIMSSGPDTLERRKQQLENAKPLRRPAMGVHADFAYGWNLDDIDAEQNARKDEELAVAATYYNEEVESELDKVVC
jgi:hypothetical protein